MQSVGLMIIFNPFWRSLFQRILIFPIVKCSQSSIVFHSYSSNLSSPLFESLLKMSIFLQVFVLAKLTPSNYKNLTLPENYPPLPTFNPNPFCSNVYSISERILLAWLNHHYEQQRLKCWKQNVSGKNGKVS